MYRCGRAIASLCCLSLIPIVLFCARPPALQAAPLRDPAVLTDMIREGWNEGYAITDIAYGDGRWAVVMTEGTGFSTQSWAHSVEFPADFIGERWDEGYRLTALTYGAGEWVVVMTDMSGGLSWAQEYFRGTAEEIDAYIEENWAAGYDVTDVAFGDGEWVVVMSKLPINHVQSYHMSAGWPEEYIAEEWDAGLDITDFAYGEDGWLVVMRGDTGYEAQGWRTREEWPSDEIQAEYDEDPERDLLDLAYGGGLWVYTTAATHWGGQWLRSETVDLPSTPVDGTTVDDTTQAQATPADRSAQQAVTTRIEEIRARPPDVVEDFQTDGGSWDSFYIGEGAGFLRGGAYHITVEVEDYATWEVADLAISDFYLEVDVTPMVGEPENDAGIIFRHVDDENFYYYALSVNGYFSLLRYVDAEWQTVLDWSMTDAVTGTGATNRLGVLAERDQIALVLNDVVLATVTDDVLAGQGIAFAAAAYAVAGADVAFDNVALWNLHAPAPDTTSPDISIERVAAIKENEPTYQDRFDDDEHWIVDSDNDLSFFLADDTLHIRIISPELIAWSRSDWELADFYVEFDVTRLDGASDFLAGVMFRTADAQNYYRYMVDMIGNYHFDRRVNGTRETLVEWTGSNVLNTEIGAVNRLGVLADGNQISLFANGVLLAEIEDDALGAGALALMVGTFDEGNAEAAFDNLEVWVLEGGEPVRAAPAVASTPIVIPTSIVAPTPIATPTPEPTPGFLPGGPADEGDRIGAIREQEPAYQDEFESGDRWLVESTNEVKRFMRDEALHIRVIPPRMVGWSDTSWESADFYLEFDVQVVSGPVMSASGVLFRIVDNQNYYQFIVDTEGYYHLAKRIDGQPETVADWAWSDVVATGVGTVNRIAVLAEGDKIALYANGVLLTEVEDGSHAAGRVAAVMSTFDEGNAEAAFDNLSIWDLPTPARGDFRRFNVERSADQKRED